MQDSDVGRMATAPYSIVFRNALVVDGLGSPPFAADVGIRDGRIRSIANPGQLEGDIAIDGSKRILSPGFIDIHSHADYTLVVDGRAQSAVLQGITSVVSGNCGHGVAPATERSRQLVPMNIPGWTSAWEVPPTWTSFSEYLDTLRSCGVGVNVFPLVAHGALRLSVAGFENRDVTKREIDEMRALAADAMEAGAVGLSTGLEYAPGLAATTEEIARIAEPIGELGGLYATHCRNRAERMVDAAEEAVAIARHARCRLQLSHFIRRPTGPGSDIAKRAMEVALGLEEYSLATRFDVFPFDYGPTPLSFLLPPWVREGSREDVAERLADVQVRSRMLEDLNPRFVATLASGIAETMFVASDGADGALVGQSLGEIAMKLNTSVPKASLEILRAAGRDFYDVTIVERWADWKDLMDALHDPNFLMMGDGVTTALDGPLSGYTFSLSDWGWVPQMLNRFVSEEGAVSLESAIARMTSGPAHQIGLTDRGRISEGCRADLVLFDPSTLGTGVIPRMLAARPTGIEAVLVNGEFVVKDGNPTEARPGTVGFERAR